MIRLSYCVSVTFEGRTVKTSGGYMFGEFQLNDWVKFHQSKHLKHTNGSGHWKKCKS